MIDPTTVVILRASGKCNYYLIMGTFECIEFGRL
jgi:hypothetical protein